jgi:hypothetical protein
MNMRIFMTSHQETLGNPADMAEKGVLLPGDKWGHAPALALLSSYYVRMSDGRNHRKTSLPRIDRSCGSAGDKKSVHEVPTASLDTSGYHLPIKPGNGKLVNYPCTSDFTIWKFRHIKDWDVLLGEQRNFQQPSCATQAPNPKDNTLANADSIAPGTT